MLEKKTLKKEGYEVVEPSDSLSNNKKQVLAQIQSILPVLVNGDGLLDASALKDFLGVENFASDNQGYSLNFAGKGLAKIKADEPTKKELKIESEQSKQFDKTENMIIKGDNLDALKILRQNYESRVKMIYIDPPYNTDSANFIYNDSFRISEAEMIEAYGIDEEALEFFENIFGSRTHSGWLYAMYPRLKLARDLLTDDGVIFISIDDNEQANLKIMCDEIFGEENFVGHIIKKSKIGGGSDSNHIVKEHEYVMTFAKSISNLNKFFHAHDKDYLKRYKEEDDQGMYFWDTVARPGLQSPLSYTVEAPDGTKIKGDWIRGQRRFYQDLQDGEIKFTRKKNNDWSVQFKQRLNKKGKKPRSMSFDLGGTIEGKNSIIDLFGEAKVFLYPKPYQLIKFLATICNSQNSIILDFFAGSGTTAHAVMDLNKEDGGNRKFILVQLDEKIDSKIAKNKPAYDFCTKYKLEPVISSICIERVNRAGDKIKREMGDKGKSLDIGYKVFSLTDRPELKEDDNGQITLNIMRATTKDKLYNMILASGEPILTAPIEELEKDLLYKIGNSIFVLGECKTELEKFSNSRIYIDGYAEISLKDWLNMLGLNKEMVKILY